MADKDVDWKKNYSTALKKNRDWRDLYALVAGKKGRPTPDYVKNELYNNKDRIIEGLQYFQLQEDKILQTRDNILKDSGSSWGKQKNAPFLLNKLQSMTGIGLDLAWEVLSNYLQYAFRGPPDSLHKFLAQNEEKSQAVIADLFCFYYRERMFILKILFHILTNTSGDLYSVVFREFIKENVKFDKLYDSVFQQLKLVSKAVQPNLSCLSHLSAPRYQVYWMEHNIREHVQLIKLMIVILKRSPGKLPPVSIIKEILELAEESRLFEKETSSHSKQSPYQLIHRFYVVHFIQLIGFDALTSQDLRLNEETVFTSVNSKIKFLMDRKAEEGPALLSVWFIVHHLTLLGTKSQIMRDFIAHTVKTSNPWKYFIEILSSQDLLEDRMVSEAVHYAIYQVAFLSVVNFGVDFVRCDEFPRLVARLVRDPHVLKHFLLNEHDGLQLVLRECERFFPVVWKPVFDIYTSIASHSESYVNQIEKRVETEVKLTELQRKVINMESLGNNVFRSMEPVRPFVALDKVVIPAGTRCVVSGDTDIFIHWDFSVSIWHVIKETLFKWSQKMVQYPKPPDEEMALLRSNVLAVLAFYNEMLKNRKEHKKVVFFAVDEMFSRIELYHERKDSEMLCACLQTSSLLLRYYPRDVLALLEVSRAIPDIDRVVLDHIQCARGDFYHSNGIKSILELVELNSGRFTVLVTYLEFILTLFELPEVFESWAALAGLQFVLRDVFPHYNQWIFAEERQRIHVQWLCVQIISRALDVTLENISPPQSSQLKQSSSDGSQPLTYVTPNKNLFANTALYHLLNWEPAIALVHIVSLGDQQLFSWVESFYSWDSKWCLELISSVHTALSILDKCILFKHADDDQKSLTRLEREIYKEPKETDTYRVVINVAGYVYNLLSPNVRYNSVKLMSRFANNRHQSLMACIGMEATTMRQMYLKPLYSSTESEEIKVAILELVTECVHKQASLAEAFLNALELKECVQKEAGEESEGFVHIALSIIRKRKETPSDRAYLASVKLLHALWHERRTLVISYIRMREHFFTNFCHPLFHITEVQRNVIPAYAYILTCLGTEIYWYNDKVHPVLLECINNLLNEGHIIRLSLYCTDQSRGTATAESDRNAEAPSHTSDSTKILIAWKEFVYVLVKSFPTKVKENHKNILCIHTLNALDNEISREGNMLAISSLAELYLLLLTSFLETNNKKNLSEESPVVIKKISSILTNMTHHYKFFWISAVVNILAASCRFFESVTLSTTNNQNLELEMHMERIIRAVCGLLTKELESFRMDRSNERTKQILPPLLCLGITLGCVVSGHSLQLWRELVSGYHIASQLVEAAAAALQVKELSDSSLLMLELLAALIRDDEWSFRQVDILELHTAWDCLKPPIQKLFGPVPVCLEEISVFEATNWYPVYMRALNLVTSLVAHPCPTTRQLAFDFIYQHEKFICDIFEFKDSSMKDTAMDLASSALRLIWHVIQAIVPWSWKLKTTIGKILVKVKHYVATVVDLLGDPDSLLKHKTLSQSQKTFPPIELEGKDKQEELHHLQSRLLSMLVECMVVLQQTAGGPQLNELLSAHQLGLPLARLRLLVEPPPPDQTGPEYHTLVNLINLTSKRLASELRIFPRSSGVLTDSTGGNVNKTKLGDEHGTASEVGRRDGFYQAKLASCSTVELALVLELTVHYTIASTLLTLQSDQMSFHQAVLFLRDLSTEIKTFLEYTQRLNYGKEKIKWILQPVNLNKYKPLLWESSDKNEIEDSVSLGCAALPESDSDNGLPSFRRSASPESRSQTHSKKIKFNQLRVPESLEHFLPADVDFDLSFVPRSRDCEDDINNIPETEKTTEFILFCHHLLKQMFSMHGFEERSLGGGM